MQRIEANKSSVSFSIKGEPASKANSRNGNDKRSSEAN